MRVVLSVLVLVAALGTAGALAVWGAQRPQGDAGAYPVLVVGPSDQAILERTVELQDGVEGRDETTVLGALQKAAREADVELELVEYAGMGTYVRAIGGHRAQGATGWIYEVQRDGAWTSGDRSAAFYELQKGDATRWTWTAG